MPLLGLQTQEGGKDTPLVRFTEDHVSPNCTIYTRTVVDPCTCQICLGEPSKHDEEVKCKCCDGDGKHYIGTPCGYDDSVDCEACRGMGWKTVKHKCNACNNKGIVHEWATIDEHQVDLDGKPVPPRKRCAKCGRIEPC